MALLDVGDLSLEACEAKSIWSHIGRDSYIKSALWALGKSLFRFLFQLWGFIYSHLCSRLSYYGLEFIPLQWEGREAPSSKREESKIFTAAIQQKCLRHSSLLCDICPVLPYGSAPAETSRASILTSVSSKERNIRECMFPRKGWVAFLPSFCRNCS